MRVDAAAEETVESNENENDCESEESSVKNASEVSEDAAVIAEAADPLNSNRD